MLNLTFDPFFNVKWGHPTTKALDLPWIAIITDPKGVHKYCGSCLIQHTLSISSFSKTGLYALQKRKKKQEKLVFPL